MLQQQGGQDVDFDDAGRAEAVPAISARIGTRMTSHARPVLRRGPGAAGLHGLGSSRAAGGRAAQSQRSGTDAELLATSPIFTASTQPVLMRYSPGRAMMSLAPMPQCDPAPTCPHASQAAP